MTWGPYFMYYICPKCGKKFKYALDMLACEADTFGKCPQCGMAGVFEQDGARIQRDNLYEEVE